ncbi:putative membrane protein [Kutzneria albida DSM 43870]|uniref:Putative membrane protein n=1 Tax=Kutzneria albida DSM 43870 TaxID=1449976 RepID=W5WFP7_9PSEU|nr:putative membrane protein [Kutzneria albida DSM 43870]
MRRTRRFGHGRAAGLSLTESADLPNGRATQHRPNHCVRSARNRFDRLAPQLPLPERYADRLVPPAVSQGHRTGLLPREPLVVPPVLVGHVVVVVAVPVVVVVDDVIVRVVQRIRGGVADVVPVAGCGSGRYSAGCRCRRPRWSRSPHTVRWRARAAPRSRPPPWRPVTRPLALKPFSSRSPQFDRPGLVRPAAASGPAQITGRKLAASDEIPMKPNDQRPPEPRQSRVSAVQASYEQFTFSVPVSDLRALCQPATGDADHGPADHRLVVV